MQKRPPRRCSPRAPPFHYTLAAIWEADDKALQNWKLKAIGAREQKRKKTFIFHPFSFIKRVTTSLFSSSDINAFEVPLHCKLISEITQENLNDETLIVKKFNINTNIFSAIMTKFRCSINLHSVNLGFAQLFKNKVARKDCQGNTQHPRSNF